VLGALGPIEILFLVAVVAVVPLAIRLAARAGDPAREALRVARRFQPWAALAVVGSFLSRRGPAAAVLAAPWLLLTLIVALHGFGRLRRDLRTAAELAIDAGCLMLPIGGGWLVLSRLGATPLGFEEPLILLTAVHFHYAAFGSLVLTGMAGRAAGEGRLVRAITGGAIVAPPLLAAGITVSPVLELLAATILVVSLCALAVLTLAAIAPGLAAAPRVLLTLSAVSLLGGMACALAYAVGEFTGIGLISLGRMARIHGPLNGLGFVLAGLVGWALVPRNLRPGAL
jgi:YndJ-like protein